MSKTDYALCPRCKSKLSLRPGARMGYCPVCNAGLKVRNPPMPLPVMDWNKQGELLDEMEKQGLGKGARRRAAGDPAWLRRTDYPNKATYEVAYKKAVATYKKPNPLWTDLLIGAASGLGFGAGIKGIDHIFKSKDGEKKIKGNNPGNTKHYGIQNEDDLFREYNKLRRKILSKPNVAASKALSELTDKELFVFIAGQTYRLRGLYHSLENAASHMKDRDRAINLFASGEDYGLVPAWSKYAPFHKQRANPWFPWKPKPKQENPARKTVVWANEEQGTVTIHDGPAAGNYPVSVWGEIKDGNVSLGQHTIGGREVIVRVPVSDLEGFTERRDAALKALQNRPMHCERCGKTVDKATAYHQQEWSRFGGRSVKVTAYYCDSCSHLLHSIGAGEHTDMEERAGHKPSYEPYTKEDNPTHARLPIGKGEKGAEPIGCFNTGVAAVIIHSRSAQKYLDKPYAVGKAMDAQYSLKENIMQAMRGAPHKVKFYKSAELAWKEFDRLDGLIRASNREDREAIAKARQDIKSHDPSKAIKGALALSDFGMVNPTWRSSTLPFGRPPSPTMAKRAQNKAERELRFALSEQERYMGSVFVTPIGQRKHDERVAAAYAQYHRVGGTKDI